MSFMVHGLFCASGVCSNHNNTNKRHFQSAFYMCHSNEVLCKATQKKMNMANMKLKTGNKKNLK